MSLWKNLRTWRHARQFEADLAEEIRLHRELSGEAAFGSVALALEQSREVWGLAWLESWKQDVRYALRGFRRAPAFALGVVATIGLGLGLNTTMFTVMNAYALRPYAVHDPHALYSFFWNTKNSGSHNLSWQQYQDLRRQSAPFSDVPRAHQPCTTKTWTVRLAQAGFRGLIGRRIGNPPQVGNLHHECFYLIAI